MRKVSLSLALLTITSLVTSLGATTASATDAEKVTICHRTDSVTNPYVTETVDQAAVDGNLGNDNGQGDHYAEHTGPLVTNEAEAQALKDNHKQWGDIIPPIEGIHNGLNWTEDGQAIYNNDCNYVTAESPSPSPTPTVTPTETPTQTPTPTETPSVLGKRRRLVNLANTGSPWMGAAVLGLMVLLTGATIRFTTTSR